MAIHQCRQILVDICYNLSTYINFYTFPSKHNFFLYINVSTDFSHQAVVSLMKTTESCQNGTKKQVKLTEKLVKD